MTSSRSTSKLSPEPLDTTSSSSNETLAPLVATLDPRAELRLALEATKVAQLNRQIILRHQIEVLQKELFASEVTTNSCDASIGELTRSLEDDQRTTPTLTAKENEDAEV